MKVEKFDASEERRILTGFIVSTPFLRQMVTRWRKDLFPSRWSNLIAGWCVQYAKRYNRAPTKAIELLAQNWVETTKEKDNVELVEAYLASLSSDYEHLAEDINPDHLLDTAAAYFDKVRLQRLAEQIQGALEAGDMDRARNLVEQSRRIEVGKGSVTDIMSDKEAWQEVFDSPRESLIAYPGALGEFYGRELSRDAFVSYFAPIKRSKSFHLLDMAWRGMLQGRKVAMFQTGDLTRRQVLGRLAARVAKRPLWAGPVRLPRHISVQDGSQEAHVRYHTEKHDADLDFKTTWHGVKGLVKKHSGKELSFKLSVYPASTCSVATIDAELDALAAAGKVPDVVVIDYADLLAPMTKGYDRRDQINETWMGMRRLSQVYHCLVVTASQTNKQSFTAKLLDATHFSEDLRKLAHVTGVIGINETLEEKGQEVQRLNWPVVRESEQSGRVVYVAGCRAVCHPCLCSTFSE